MKMTRMSHFFATMLLGVALNAQTTGGELGEHDKAFVKEAAMGGLMEVQLGQTAKQKAQAADVKQFGTRMATDHGKANAELKQLARRKGETLPTTLEGKQKSMVEDLGKVSGTDFDKQYIEEMVKDHAADVGKFKQMSMNASDAELKAWAAKTLPVLEQHLKSVKGIATKLNLDVNKLESEGQQEAEQAMTH